jgi:hypothetical protein
VACATDVGRVYTEQELATAEQNRELEALYERVAVELGTLDPGSKAAANTRETLERIGGRLAEKLERDIQQEFDSARLETGLIPRDALLRERERLAKMERWDENRFGTVTAQIEGELGRTENAIAENRSRLHSLKDEQVLERLRVLEALGELTGAGSEQQAQYVEERLSILDEMRKRAEEALAEEDIDEARRVLKIIQEVDPEAAAVDDQLVEVDAKVFERDFWSALERGDPDAAFGAFQTLAGSSSFEKVRPRLEGSADKMATYFSTLAAGATEEDRLEDAYRWFVQAREIKRALGRDAWEAAPEEKSFIARMQAAHREALEKSRPGLAWGYLNVIEQLTPSSPSLRRQLRETRDTVVVAATRRLTAFPFKEAPHEGPQFGEAVASKVIQYLFEAIPQDVRIIEREQLADILREREIGRQEGGAGTGLASADYLVQGDILEARVDTTEQAGRKTMRVVTEHEEKPNPKHQWWLGLGSGERRKTPEPPETIMVPRKEDISIAVTVHRKVGIFSVSYRVIDAETARVMFTGSLREKAEHQDESSEGVELGEFSLKFKLAELPSDLEILAQLADAISLKIGQRLAEELKDPEVEYQKAAERHASEGNHVAASEQYAYAVALAERKGKPVDSLREKLRKLAVASSAGSH